MITEPTIRIEPKGRDSYEVPNALDILMMTNSKHAVPAGETARRFGVEDVSPVMMGNKVYWDRFYAAVGNPDVLAAFVYELETMTLPAGWHPKDHIPQTAALMNQKVHTMKNDISGYLFKCLERGSFWQPDHHGIAPQVKFGAKMSALNAKGDWRTSTAVIDKAAKIAIQEAVGYMTGTAPTIRVVTDALKKYLGGRVIKVNGETYVGISSLDHCRTNFSKAVGGKVEWDDDATQATSTHRLSAGITKLQPKGVALVPKGSPPSQPASRGAP